MASSETDIFKKWPQQKNWQPEKEAGQKLVMVEAAKKKVFMLLKESPQKKIQNKKEATCMLKKCHGANTHIL